MTCSVCLLEPLAEAACTLSCGHRFCLDCLKRCAEQNHTACPNCRAPHVLDPYELEQRLNAYRASYRSWRMGGCHGAAGEVAGVTVPKTPFITQDSEPVKEVSAQCKNSESFRDYAAPHERGDVVTRHYRDMHRFQTVEFVNSMHAKYAFRDGACRCEMTIEEAFAELEGYVDSSDPDLGLPNKVHMLQTAEGIRAAGHPDWMVFVGLVHDMGKIMYLWGCADHGQVGTADGPQWALGGDTWVVGCELPSGEARPGVVLPEFFEASPDKHDPRYQGLGLYAAGCGVDNLLFAYGHDEYLYQMLTANGAKLPKAALAMIRFHSAYPWHTARIYDHFMTPDDHETLKHVLEFNKFDLYTKDELNEVDVDAVWPYYQGLIDKFCPGKLKW